MICIYKITNNINSDVYIGSTKSFDLRKFYHMKDLKERKHCNYKLQRDYNKGVVFTFHVLEQTELKTLIEREQYYIDLLKPRYNICKVAGANKQDIKKAYKAKKKRNKKLNDIADMNVMVKYSH